MDQFRKVIISFFALLLISCGIGLDIPKHDPRFDSIRNQFKNDAAFFGHSTEPSDVSITFGNPRKKYELLGMINVSKDPGKADAICLQIPRKSNEFIKLFNESVYGKYAGHKIVIIDNSYSTKTAEQIEAIVYHELGHCVLDLPHDKNQFIMAPASPAISLGAYRYFYLQEMFTGEKEFPVLLKHLKADELLGRDDQLELVYEADYQAINGQIKNVLYYDTKNEMYYLLIEKFEMRPISLEDMDL